MTPELAVKKLATIISACSEVNSDEIYKLMNDERVPFGIANMAYKFTQIYFGRTLLNGMGIRFSPNYYCFDQDGDITESGPIDEQPYYRSATQIPYLYDFTSSFKHFGAMSSEVAAINDALRAGSRPEDLVSAPPAIFIEEPTIDGKYKVEDFMKALLSDMSNQVPDKTSPKPKKSWWEQL